MAEMAVQFPPPMNAAAINFRSNAEIDVAQRQQAEQQRQSQIITPLVATGLAGFVKTEFEAFKRHRDSASGWSSRLLDALRAFNGKYDPQKLMEIQKFGGSQSYARIIAQKCRGASSLLRDIYLNLDRPWGFQPPDDVDIPPEALRTILKKVEIEVTDQEETTGAPISEEDIRGRTLQLLEAVREGQKKKAAKRTKIAEEKVNDLLEQGNFYGALADFITDVPLFPFGCIKGPIVRIVPVVDWFQGTPRTIQQPRLTWARISPFDIWFTPGVTDIADAAVIERQRYTRADLNDLLDLPGYDHKAIREVLRVHGQGGLNDDWDGSESSRAVLESRENPNFNVSRLITAFEYHGNVQGLMLLSAGMTTKQVPDPLRDYAVEAWVIGGYVIKVQLAPSPRRRHPYFITSFEKVPGTPVGNALPDILADIQEMINACFRSLGNNMAMASGPQVVVNEDRLSGMESGDEIYPWKRWRVTSDPFGNSSVSNKPVDFFQPQSNAQELLTVLRALIDWGDDISAIPRYLQGSNPGGGAGRTASGLAMLMGNASKILQTVAANIDRDVIEPALRALLDVVLLTDTTDILDGTEKIIVKGVAVAMQRETQRSRQLEFLQITANPIDAQIMGPEGRGVVLRTVSETLGMPGEKIVPSADDIRQQAMQAQAIAAAQGIPGHGGMGAEGPSPQADAPPGPSQDTGPRTNLVGKAPARPGNRVAGGPQ